MTPKQISTCYLAAALPGTSASDSYHSVHKKDIRKRLGCEVEHQSRSQRHDTPAVHAPSHASDAAVAALARWLYVQPVELPQPQARTLPTAHEERVHQDEDRIELETSRPPGAEDSAFHGSVHVTQRTAKEIPGPEVSSDRQLQSFSLYLLKHGEQPY
eukprot:scaffold42778_cov23-Tisochrysis_lutea.AAC.1